MLSVQTSPVTDTRRSKSVAQRELERPRPAGPEKLPRCVESLIEICRVNRIVNTGVVPVGRASDVGYIEQVEGFRNELQGMRLFEMKRPRQAHIKGVEVVAELDSRVYLKRPGASGIA